MIRTRHYLLYFFVIFTFISSTIAANAICSEEFCTAYKEKTVCAPLTEPCVVQNSTLNGRIFSSHTPCSCCNLCLQNLFVDDDCTIGAPGSPLPVSICGPGLSCQQIQGVEHTKCRPMVNTKCFQAQAQYELDRDNGDIGHLMQRPECDADGDFTPVHCIPGQTCFCVDKEGNRIFGEAIHQPNINVIMKCECSRLVSMLSKFVGDDLPLTTVRCDEMGSFNTVQCIDDACVCVDEHDGSQTSVAFNLTRGLTSMPCFERGIHRNSTFLRQCEIEKMERLANRAQFEEDDIFIIDITEDFCQPDGFYGPVQRSHTHIFCADIYGEQLKSYGFLRTDPEAINMNCKCARALELLESVNSVELPKCCPNGNYEKLQCRRGFCYCVNEDGSQTTVEVQEYDKENLECYANVCNYN